MPPALDAQGRHPVRPPVARHSVMGAWIVSVDPY